MPPKQDYWNYHQSILNAFVQQKYCDVTFACLNNEEKWVKISAHKFILAMASDVFEIMFYGKATENGAVKVEKEIKIDDIRSDTFKLLLG